MDKEVDLKNGVINALSLKEVQRMFDEIQLTYELSDSHARIIVYGAIQFAELNKSTDYFIKHKRYKNKQKLTLLKRLLTGTN